MKTASNRAIRIAAAGTSDLICNKIANKITKNSPQNNPEADSQTEEWKPIETPKDICISPEKEQQIIDDLRIMK